MDTHQKVISDEDWNKLANELDGLFNKISRHSEFKDGINRLFTLGSIVSSQMSSVSNIARSLTIFFNISSDSVWSADVRGGDWSAKGSEGIGGSIFRS